MQRPRVSKYGLKTFLCIFWNSSGVLQNELLETSLKVTPYVKYHTLTKVAYKYCSHYNRTSKNCRSLCLQDNARKHTTNQRRAGLLHWIFTLVATQRVAPTFCSLQRFLAEKCWMTSRRWKRCFFIIPICACINSVRKLLGNQIKGYPIFKIFSFSFGCCFVSC